MSWENRSSHPCSAEEELNKNFSSSDEILSLCVVEMSIDIGNTYTNNFQDMFVQCRLFTYYCTHTHQYIYPNNSAYPKAACLCLWITWNRDLYLNNSPPLQNYCAFLRSFLSSIRYKRGEGRRNSLWFTCVYFKEQMQQFPTNLFCMLTKIAIFLWKDPKNDKNGFKRPTTLIFQLKYHKPKKRFQGLKSSTI